MTRTLKTLAIAAALAATVLATSAQAKTYTYMCRVDSKSYPVTVTTPNEAKGSLSGGTITWRNRVFHNVEETGDCKAKFVATSNRVTIELCAATQGVADLKVGEDTFECEMERRRR
jgi:hypothetical protein